MVENILQSIFIISVFFLLSVVLDKLLYRIQVKNNSAASESFRLISNSQKTILIFIGVVLAISKLGFDVTGIVAGLGLTGFALGFALKDAISNLVAGVMIVLYQPIKLGNTIEVISSKGKVVDINLRYITIKNEGVTYLIPNATLLSNKVAIIEDEEPSKMPK